jgi:hypothetical protein
MARPSSGAAEWAARIDQWRESGLSLPAFCQRHGLSRGTMQNWVYKPMPKRAVDDARRASQTPLTVRKSFPAGDERRAQVALGEGRVAGDQRPSHRDELGQLQSGLMLVRLQALVGGVGAYARLGRRQ